MLYVNEELVNTRNRTGQHASLVEDYHKTIQELKDTFGDYLVVETKIQPRRDKNTGVLRLPGPRGLLLKSNVNRKDKDGYSYTEELMYSPRILKKDKETGTLILDSPNILVQRAMLTIDLNHNPDLAYYIMKCGYVGRTPAEGKKFHVYDPAFAHKQNASRRRLEGQVLNLIYSSIPEEKLRTIAKSFGIPEVSIKDLETVREELYEKLQANEDAKKTKPGSSFRGFQEFIESAEVKYQDQITALCVDAIDKGNLVYEDNERRWVIDYKDKATPYVLKELGGEEVGDPLGSVVSYLISEPNKLRKVENVMGIGRSDEPVPEITLEDVMKEHKVPVLKSWIKKLDPTLEVKPTLKGQEAKEILLGLIGQKSLQETQG